VAPRSHISLPQHSRGQIGNIEPGGAAQLVRDYVHDRGADLVVLRTHGRGAVLEALLGSTAKSTLSLPCDALVVRGPRQGAPHGGRCLADRARIAASHSTCLSLALHSRNCTRAVIHADCIGGPKRGSGLRRWKHANVQTDMTSRIDGNLVRDVIRINAGWVIWAGSLLITSLVNASGCEPHRDSARILDIPGASFVPLGAGALAAAGALVVLLRALSNCRAHRTGRVSGGDFAVECLAAAVAGLSLLGILWTTLLPSASPACAP
jgi:universal stress protein family protein